MEKLIQLANFAFDPIHFWWKRHKTQQWIATLLIFIFLGSLFLIELKRLGLISSYFLMGLIPANPFYAVHLAFSLLLLFEVISFIFVLPCSVSKAVSKQLEILSLIFLRNCFKLLIEFNEPVSFTHHLDAVLQIGTYGLGAMLIYLMLGFYYLLMAQKDEKLAGEEIFYFVGAKKGVSLLLILIFLGMGLYNLSALVHGETGIAFFHEFYTVLIFSDILVVLISHRFFPSFNDVFRNSGYAIATLLIRLSLTAPIFYDVAIGTGASLFALALTYLHSKVSSVSR